MSVQYKIRSLAVSTALDYWDNICQNAGVALVHTMPTFDNVNLKNLRPYWFLVDANAMGLQTVDGSLFNINGATAYTVSAPGLYKFEYVEGRWYMTATDMVPTTNDLKLENVIHVAKNGDDALAALSTFAPFSIKFPYLTIEAAHAASTVNHTIMVWPGKYTMTASLDFDGSKARKIYHQPGVTITSYPSDYQYKIVPLETAYILGYADYNMKFPMIANTSPNDNICFFEWEFGNIINDSLGAVFQAGTFASMKGSVRGRKITDCYFSANAWNQIDFKVDEWIAATSSMLQFDDPNTFNGTTYIGAYGPAQFNLSGLSKVFTMLNKSTYTATAQALINVQQGGAAHERLINLDAHFRTMDSPGINQDASIIKWRGDAYHSKSNLAGNEMPFYYATSPLSGDKNKPVIEHWGTIITKSTDEYPFKNCTLMIIRCGGTFIWHGNYKQAGFDDSGLGTPFPVIEISNQDVDGTTRGIFDGVFMTGQSATVGPMKINETGSEENLLEIIFMNNLAICEGTEKIEAPIYSTTGRPTRLFVMHSLGLSGPLDEAIFGNYMSNNRMYYDTDVKYKIPEYID